MRTVAETAVAKWTVRVIPIYLSFFLSFFIFEDPT